MKDEFDILFSREEGDIEHISENYAAAGEKEKEKIYKISKRKYNMQKSEEAQGENDGYTKQAEGVEQYRRPILNRILTAAAALIVVAGLAGGMRLMLNRGKPDFGTDTELAEESNLTAPDDTEPEPTTAVYEESEFAPLQLHELKEFDNSEEFEAYRDYISEVWENGGCEFKKVDVEKYAQQILDASSSEELNTLENKSFLYHLVLNSILYFDTAELTYDVNSYDGNKITKINVENAVDLSGRYVYNKFDTLLGDKEPFCQYVIMDENKSMDIGDFCYSEREITDAEWESFTRYLPDNDRIAFGDEYKVWIADGYYIPFEPAIHNFSILCHFEKWSIVGTENILGRDCAHIIHNDRTNQLDEWIDLRTGISLKHMIDHSNGKYYNAEAVSLTINEPIQKREIDLSGLIKINE